MNEVTTCKRASHAMWLAIGLLAGLGLAPAIARAEPRGGPAMGQRPMPPSDGRDAPDRHPGEPGEPPPHPLLLVFDPNHDGDLAATGIAAASAVLHSFDADGEGQLSADGLRRALPPPDRGGRPPREAHNHGE